MIDPSTSFDAEQYKQTQREQWNKDGAAWHYWHATLERWYGELTRQILDSAFIQPRQHVLDIAAGAGEPAFSAAERVGLEGYVLATDISDGIIALARQAASDRGLTQVATRVMDGEVLSLPDASFDAVICRLGLMYMPHPGAALREWHRVLKPGGHVAVAVFSTADRNSWGAIPASIIRRRAQLPPPVAGQPGPFSLGYPEVLQRLFIQAGFSNLSISTVLVPHRAASATEYVRVAREAFGGFNAMMASLPCTERESAWHEIETSLHCYETTKGFEAPGECYVVAATK
ncbi:class I SAM-dependent methyltransferase [Pantoea sp. At-9b]|uniref:class I SAM-dependent methyltransferase n=1 Tax=Pantoea sp. (strain At-9b) TaxID=592316 RepID=UPI0001B40A33|nr:methyltransferase domain-containing protein [Pantoea sp. At-9b]ADU68842.1 Methyltransferase type 11 [Pantoea sp. At-9b]